MPLKWKIAAALLGVLPIFSCSGKRPSGIGVSGSMLAPCPSSPNCVSSDAPDAAHRVSAFALTAAPDESWRIIRKEVAALPRVTITEETDDYIHAECASALFGFVDDLELHLRKSAGLVAVRSASRIGYYDFGVNRRRVERLREILRDRGVVQ